MKKLIPLALSLCLSANGFSQCADTANIYQFEYEGKNYEVVKELKNWVDAAACSKERGGYLADILDLDEQNTIFDAILNGAGVSDTYVEILNGGGIAYVWIGATDKEEEGKWIWDGNDDKLGLNFWTGQGANGDNDGAAVEEAYFNWGGTSTGTPNEPDNYGAGGQDMAAIGLTGWPKGSTDLGKPGEWNDIQGSSELYYVIEYDTISTGIHNLPELQTNLNELNIYPNPASEIFYINTHGIEHIELYSITGKRIGSFQRSPVDISHYEKGVYVVKVRTQSGMYTEKIFVE